LHLHSSIIVLLYYLTVWLSGNASVLIDVVVQRRARLVLGWVPWVTADKPSRYNAT